MRAIDPAAYQGAGASFRQGSIVSGEPDTIKPCLKELRECPHHALKELSKSAAHAAAANALECVNR